MKCIYHNTGHFRLILIDLLHYACSVKLTMKDIDYVDRKNWQISTVDSLLRTGPVLSYHPSGQNPLYCINAITLDFCDI